MKKSVRQWMNEEILKREGEDTYEEGNEKAMVGR